MVVGVTMLPLPLLITLLLGLKMAIMVSKRSIGSKIIPHQLNIIRCLSLLLQEVHLGHPELLRHNHRLLQDLI